MEQMKWIYTVVRSLEVREQCEIMTVTYIKYLVFMHHMHVYSNNHCKFSESFHAFVAHNT